MRTNLKKKKAIMTLKTNKGIQMNIVCVRLAERGRKMDKYLIFDAMVILGRGEGNGVTVRRIDTS